MVMICRNWLSRNRWRLNRRIKSAFWRRMRTTKPIGCGGLLALYGPQCDVILLTDGAKGGDRSKPDEVRRVREAEFEEVMQFFDVRFYQFMRAEDGNLIEAYRLFQKLDLSGYDYVFMPHGWTAIKTMLSCRRFSAACAGKTAR